MPHRIESHRVARRRAWRTAREAYMYSHTRRPLCSARHCACLLCKIEIIEIIVSFCEGWNIWNYCEIFVKGWNCSKYLFRLKLFEVIEVFKIIVKLLKHGLGVHAAPPLRLPPLLSLLQQLFIIIRIPMFIIIIIIISTTIIIIFVAILLEATLLRHCPCYY